jgi:hypothetical protein
MEKKLIIKITIKFNRLKGWTFFYIFALKFF